MLTCQFVHMSVFLATACEVVRRSCCGKDNGPMLRLHLLPLILDPQQAFIRSCQRLNYQIKLQNKMKLVYLKSKYLKAKTTNRLKKSSRIMDSGAVVPRMWLTLNITN